MYTFYVLPRFHVCVTDNHCTELLSERQGRCRASGELLDLRVHVTSVSTPRTLARRCSFYTILTYNNHYNIYNHI
jgi:hypothetical protein